MVKHIPPVSVPQKIVNTCSDCPHFKMFAGWDGEYYCEKTGKEFSYGIALEEIQDDCPLEGLEEQDAV